MPVDRSPTRMGDPGPSGSSEEQLRQIEADLAASRAALAASRDENARLLEARSLPLDANFGAAGSNDASSLAAIAAVSRQFKLTNFSREQPDLWFFQAEVAFRSANIKTSWTKASKIIENIDMEALATIRDLLSIEPSPDDLYERIKDRLITTFGCSAETRLRQLIKGQVSTCGKPSLVLSRLRALDPCCPQGIVRAIFFEQLPSACRAVLSVSDEPDLDKLARMADKFAEVNEASSVHIAAVANSGPTSESAGLRKELERLSAKLDKLDKLEKDVAFLKKRLCRSASRGRERSRERSRPASPRRTADGGSASLCWAHQRYGDNAYSCSKTCSRWAGYSKSAGPPAEN